MALRENCPLTVKLSMIDDKSNEEHIILRLSSDIADDNILWACSYGLMHDKYSAEVAKAAIKAMSKRSEYLDKRNESKYGR